MERWCLCRYCIQAIESRGEKIFSRRMDFDDCTEEEYETELVKCDWCENEYDLSEMYICK